MAARTRSTPDRAIDALVVVSDLHCGSSVGLCPPRFRAHDDFTIEHSARMAWLWDRWTEFGAFVAAAMRGRRYAVVVNGDAIEGNHHRCRELLHADPGVHVNIAIETLRPLTRDAAALFITRGTEAHSGHTAEHGVGAALEAVPVDGNAAPDHWFLRVNGVDVSVKHHIAASIRANLEAGGLGRAYVEETYACAYNGWPVPRVLLRAHRHRAGLYSDMTGWIVVTPSWQLPTRYVKKIEADNVPHVGGAIIDLADPVNVRVVGWKRAYVPPVPREVR